MSKYIKLDDAIGIITEHQGIRGDTFKALHNAYAIDLVRCRERKWEWTQKCPPHRMGLIHDESDYCSYGIRRADDE